MVQFRASRHAISPGARAALFGSHHAAWRKETAQPFLVRRDFAELAPEPLSQSLRTAAGAAGSSAEREVLDASIAEVTRLRRDDNSLTFDKLLRTHLPQDYCDDLTTDSDNNERNCTCCRHAHGRDHAPLSSKRRGPQYEHIALSSAPGVEPPKVVGAVAELHKPSIAFDEDTWISTAGEHVIFGDVQADEADRVFCVADPRDWDLCAPGTFERTLAGRMKNGRFEKFVAEYHPIWEEERGGYLFEDVVWDFNPRVQGGAQNVLRFTEAMVRKRRLNEGALAGPWMEMRGDDAVVTPSKEPGVLYEWTYGYKYDLHLCLGANLMGAYQPGGLDVDEGSFTVVWNESTEKLELRAEKKLHYSQQPGTIEGFELMMNLMAPALTGMFMRQMAVRGVAAAIDGEINPRQKRNLGGLE